VNRKRVASGAVAARPCARHFHAVQVRLGFFVRCAPGSRIFQLLGLHVPQVMQVDVEAQTFCGNANRVISSEAFFNNAWRQKGQLHEAGHVSVRYTLKFGHVRDGGELSGRDIIEPSVSTCDSLDEVGVRLACGVIAV
jgi:hypothetical protein